MSNIALGVDIGGTNIRAGLVNLASGGLVGKDSSQSTYDKDHRGLIERLATEGYGENARDLPSSSKKRLFAHSLENIYTVIGEVIEEGVVGIGIGSPGPLDPIRGIIGPRGGDIPSNLFGWDAVHLAQLVTDKFGVPCKVNGDVRVMALGELLFGAAKGLSTFMMIAPGTGFGCGVIEGGKLHDGKYHTSGEIWKIPVIRERRFGIHVLDYYGSINGIERIFRENLVLEGVEDMEVILFPHGCDAKKVTEAARDHLHPAHDRAKVALQKYGALIGLTLSGPLNTINMERLVIGGKGLLHLDLFGPALQKELDTWLTYPIELTPAVLAEKAGIIGAACLFRI